MALEDLSKGLLAQRVNIGLSSIIGVTVSAGQLGCIFQFISGGSLEIGGATLTWGNGFIVAPGSALNLNQSSTFYLAASGATAVCQVLKSLSQGNEGV